jgi:hypothetical protein
MNFPMIGNCAAELAVVAVEHKSEPGADAVRHLLRAQVDQRLGVQALEVGRVAAVYRVRVGPADHLERDLVSALAGLRPSADQGAPPAARSGTLACRSRSSNSIFATPRAYARLLSRAVVSVCSGCLEGARKLRDRSGYREPRRVVG